MEWAFTPSAVEDGMKEWFREVGRWRFVLLSTPSAISGLDHTFRFQDRGFIWGLWMVGNCKARAHLYFCWRKVPILPHRDFQRLFWVGIDLIQVALLSTAAQVAKSCLKGHF